MKNLNLFCSNFLLAKKIILIAILLLLSSKLSSADDKFNQNKLSKKNAYQFSFTAIDGNKISLSDFQNKVILVVNTASKCGFTPQYQSLQNLYQKYRNSGLVIIAVPSNDFGNQEFSDGNKISQFTQQKFNITFPITSLTKVSSDQAHPFYLWANQQSGFFNSPKWNFHKYLIDKNGQLAASFSSITDPMNKEITDKIEELLEK